MVRSEGYEPRFDLNLREGLHGEDTVAAFLGLDSSRIEVKRKSYRDTHFYIEYEHDPDRKQVYRPSGIQTTTAHYWVFVIDDTGIQVVIPTVKLRAAFDSVIGQFKAETDGDCPTHGRLVSLAALLNITDTGQTETLF